ncbi:MAG: hypothetical protein AAGN66_21560 [Acidobacteriota bacterium]
MFRFSLHLAPLLVAYLLVALLFVGSPTLAEDLAPTEPVLRSLFRAVEGEPKPYLRAEVGRHFEFPFCGEGRLAIHSRAMLEPRVRAARYSLTYSLDGQPEGVTRRFRAERTESGRFGPDLRAGGLRSIPLDVARGCHTLKLALDASTESVVGLRVTFAERSPTKRAWEGAQVHGGQDATVWVGDRTTPYRRLAPAETLNLRVVGPAWVRLLVRTAGAEPGVHRLDVQDGGEPLRSYLIESRPSTRARPGGDPTSILSRADEVTFPVGPGDHDLGVRSASGVDLLVRAQVAARSAGERGESRWATRARLSLLYDDNILRYSERFIARFEQGRDPDRFRVSSLDDWIQRVELNTERTFRGLAGREAGIELGLEHRAYQDNSIKDWSQVSLAWSQQLARGRSFKLRAAYLPDFYVRHLRDSDLTGRVGRPESFQSFDFSKRELRAEYRQPLGRSSNLRAHLGFAQFDHSDAFREFDSDNGFLGARLDHRISSSTRLSFAAEWTHSEARGFDEAGETRATSDDTDPTYRQLDLMTAVRFQLPSRKRQLLFFQAEVGLRDYTTSKPSSLAPLHFGREDELLRIYASWQLDLSDRYTLTVYAQRRERSSTAPVELDVGVEKNYDQLELGTRLAIRF